MREIKFRAWDNVNKRMGYFRPGFSWQDEYDIWCLMDADDDRSKSITDVPCNDNINLMQYTGLFDKNREEICEGDIVKCHDHPTGLDDVTSYVEFKYGSFIIAYNGRVLSDYGTAWTEVIGNIYQNPELNPHH